VHWTSRDEIIRLAPDAQSAKLFTSWSARKLLKNWLLGLDSDALGAERSEARRELGRAREPIPRSGIGSSGWTRTSNPPLTVVIRKIDRDQQMTMTRRRVNDLRPVTDPLSHSVALRKTASSERVASQSASHLNIAAFADHMKRSPRQASACSMQPQQYFDF
jgi:hypothetical protein